VSHTPNLTKPPYLGYGLGLRSQHYPYILEHQPAVDWFEVMTENYLVAGGRPLYYLDRIHEQYPLVMHGVSLSIGSCDPLDMDYLVKLKKLAQRINPKWISDHLCWTGVNGLNMHDLLPLPYTEEALQHVVERVTQVQDFLGQQILLENVSSYITYTHSHLSEWEFLTAVAEQADCLLLLDVNNIYVSAFNHKFNPQDYLNGVPIERVQQFHLSGHEHCGTHIIDTHDASIVADVWKLYAEAVRRFGRVSTMIERDDHIPELPELLTELNQAKSIAEKVLVEQQTA
jgi:uncharacterized protein (UPF0276 family)